MPRSIDSDWNTSLEFDLHTFFAVGRFLRGFRNLPGGRKRRVGGVFEFSALVAQVPEITVTAVNLHAACGYRNPMLLRVIEAVFARLQLPFAPRRDDLQAGRERLVSQFEAHLVVSFSGAPVCNRDSSLAYR